MHIRSTVFENFSRLEHRKTENSISGHFFEKIGKAYLKNFERLHKTEKFSRHSPGIFETQ